MPSRTNAAPISRQGGNRRRPARPGGKAASEAEIAGDDAGSSLPLPAARLTRAGGPLYRQLAALLRQPIQTGSFAVGLALPKEAEIAAAFGISLITVRQALRELEGEGLIRKRPAKPAVVAARAPQPRIAWGFKNFADIDAFTRDARLDIASYRRERFAPGQAAFGLAPREACWCLRGTLRVGGEPEAAIIACFPPDIGARLGRADFDDVLIFRSLQRHLGIRLAAAGITVTAETADERLAAALDYVAGGALLTMEMLYRDGDQRPVEFTIARHRADRFRLTYEAPNDLP